jgi:hypothetical protein
LDLDFHSVPVNSEKAPLQNNYVSRHNRSQKGVLVFLARDAEQRVMCYANAHVTKSEQADEILCFVQYLVDSGLADQPTPMPWLEDKNLVIAFA